MKKGLRPFLWISRCKECGTLLPVNRLLAGLFIPSPYPCLISAINARGLLNVGNMRVVMQHARRDSRARLSGQSLVWPMPKHMRRDVEIRPSEVPGLANQPGTQPLYKKGTNGTFCGEGTVP